MSCPCDACQNCKSIGPGGVTRKPDSCMCYGRGYAAAVTKYGEDPEIKAILRRNVEHGMRGSGQ